MGVDSRTGVATCRKLDERSRICEAAKWFVMDDNSFAILICLKCGKRYEVVTPGPCPKEVKKS